MPRVIANVYEVQLADGLDFGPDVLGRVDALSVAHPNASSTPKGQTRWQNTGDGWLVCDVLAQVAGKHPRWEGAIMRATSDDLPHVSGPGGIRPLKLQADDDLGRHVAFLYDETSKLLWLQRDRNVCGKFYFGEYLRAISGTAFGITPRFRTDAVKRAKKLGNLRSIKFAYLDGDSTKPRGTLEKMLDRFRGYGAARIEIRLAPVRGGTLNKKAFEVLEGIGEGIDEGAIGAANVTGRRETDDEHDTYIDLLRDREQMSTNIPPNRLRDPKRLIAAVNAIWSDNRLKV